jgi:transmembrane sensor
MNESIIHAEAARWLVRRDRAVASGDTFENWLARDPRHRAAYLRLELAWRHADRLRGLRPLNGRIDADLLRHEPASRAAWRYPLWAAAAALLAAATFALWPQLQWRSYTTEVGGYQRVALPDGSTMELNTGTTLRVRLRSDRREVRLLQGEALFRVAHDARRPFDVSAAGKTIRAVGTEFNVWLRGSRRIEVLVTQGRVAVAQGRLGQELTASSVSMLEAGQQAVAVDGAVAVQAVPPADVGRRLAWQEGDLIFQGETLAQAVNQLNRYSRRHLSIQDESLLNLSIGGNFKATDIESFIRALRESFGIEALPRSDGGYELRRGARGIHP